MSTRTVSIGLAVLLALASFGCRSADEGSSANRLYVAQGAMFDDFPPSPLQIFDIDSNGALTHSAARIESGAPEQPGPHLFSHLSGRHLISARNRMRMFEIDDEGNLTRLPETASAHRGVVAGPIAAHPDGRHLYAFNPMRDSSPAATLVLEMGDGESSPFFQMVGELLPLSCDGLAAAVDPSGTLLFCSTEDGRAIQVLDVLADAGSFSAAATVEAPERIRAISAHPGGELVYVLSGAPIDRRSDWTESRITGYRRTPLVGRITPVARGETWIGESIVAIALTPDGRFLFALDKRMGLVLGFAIEAEGQLRELTRQRTGEGPSLLAIHPTSRFLYVANTGSDDVSAFSITEGGELVPMPGSPAPLSATPVAMTFGR